MRSIAVALLILLGPLAYTAAAEELGFKVVSNAGNPVETLTKNQVAAMFLKRINKWSTGVEVRPVDQVYASAVRERFSRAILGKSVRAAKAYWQQQVFAGYDIPPMEKATDQDVMKFVAANPGAIGYVSEQTPLIPDVKKIAVEDVNPRNEELRERE